MDIRVSVEITRRKSSVVCGRVRKGSWKSVIGGWKGEGGIEQPRLGSTPPALAYAERRLETI
jgi:hypothetical protein